jgi:hypothetical protein
MCAAVSGSRTCGRAAGYGCVRDGVFDQDVAVKSPEHPLHQFYGEGKNTVVPAV